MATVLYALQWPDRDVNWFARVQHWSCKEQSAALRLCDVGFTIRLKTLLFCLCILLCFTSIIDSFDWPFHLVY